MNDLIKALTIFAKYKDDHYPTHCEHDVLLIMGISLDEVSEEDQAELDRLGFHWNTEFDCWGSFRYGSA